MSDLIRREDAYDMVRNSASMSDALDAIDALPAVQPDARIKEYEEAYQYALHLAEALRENFPPNPDFRFLGDLVGLLTQIDNMVAGMSQPTEAERDRLREALERIAESEPRPKRSGDYDRADVSALQRIARTALKGETP